MTAPSPTPGTLSAAQREALASRLRKGRAGASTAIPRRGSSAGPLPLSFAQEQLWFIDQFHRLPTYNIPSILRFSGEFDVAALHAALTGLVRRHETLRTRLVSNADGRPIQGIDPPAPVELPRLDLRDDPDPQARLTELAEAQAFETFDLATGPLWW